METWNTDQWRKAEAEAAQQAINYYESSQSAEVRQDFYNANLLHARATLWAKIADQIDEALKRLPD